MKGNKLKSGQSNRDSIDFLSQLGVFNSNFLLENVSYVVLKIFVVVVEHLGKLLSKLVFEGEKSAIKLIEGGKCNLEVSLYKLTQQIQHNNRHTKHKGP